MMSRIRREAQKRIDNLADIFNFFLGSDSEDTPPDLPNPPTPPNQPITKATKNNKDQSPQFNEVKIEIVTETIPAKPEKKINVYDKKFKKSVAALIARESEKRRRILARELKEGTLVNNIHKTLEEGWELPSNPDKEPSNPDKECHGFTLV